MKLSLAQRQVYSFHTSELQQGLAADKQAFLSAGSDPVGLQGYLSNTSLGYEIPSFSEFFGDLVSGEFTYWFELVILIFLIVLVTFAIYDMYNWCNVDAPKTRTHLDKARNECSALTYENSRGEKVKVAYKLDNMRRYLFDPSDAECENILQTMQDKSKIEEQVEAERTLPSGFCDRMFMCGATNDDETQFIRQTKTLPTGPVTRLKWNTYGHIFQRNPPTEYGATQEVEDEIQIRTDQQVACLLRLDDDQFAHLKNKMQKDLNSQSLAEFNTTSYKGGYASSEEGKSVSRVEELLFLDHLLQKQGHFDVGEFEEASDFKEKEDLVDEEVGEQIEPDVLEQIEQLINERNIENEQLRVD